MKYLFFFIILFLTTVFPSKSKEIVIHKNKKQAEITLISSSDSAIGISFKINAFNLDSMAIEGKSYDILSFENSTSLFKKGAPQLPKISTSAIVPAKGKMELVIVSTNYVDYPDFEILPSKGVVYRDQDPSQIPYSFGEEYKKNAFYPKNIAATREPYIVRDFRGQTIVFTPFQYNPVTKILRVHYDFKVFLKPTPDKGINELDPSSVSKLKSQEFQNIYKSHFVNFNPSKYTPVSDEGNMLIICPAQFMDEMQEFVDWKKQKGIPVEIINVEDIGQSSAIIKQYVKDYYNDHGLTFLLLVGDHYHVPPMYKSGYSDAAYGHIEGSDSYGEVIVGRFSAETEAHLSTQIQRTIHYELYMNEDNPWLEDALGIASSEGGGGAGDDNESDKQHMNNIKSDLINYGYESVSEQYDPGVISSDVLLEINEGKGLINYVGHGDISVWVTSGFTSDHINNLTNAFKLPFIFDVACQNGNFYQKTCFAESFLRATHNGNPTGAVAIIASTINQPWAPPMDGQDEMVDILVESYTNNRKRSYGGITLNGCMHMNDEYGDYGGYETTNTWTIFGDPSLSVRTRMPEEIEVDYVDDLFIEDHNFTFTTPTAGLTACLTLDGQTLGITKTVAGENHFVFDSLKSEGKAIFTLTGYNKITHHAEIRVLPNSGPYIEFYDFTVVDSTENDNQLADFGETIYLDISVINNGFDPTSQVSSTLISDDPYIHVIEEEFFYGNIEVTEVQNGSSFKVIIKDSIPDQHESTLLLKLKDSYGREREEYIALALNAPEIDIKVSGIDVINLEENRLPHPGEAFHLKLVCKNSGNASLDNLPFLFTSESPLLEIVQVPYEALSMGRGEEITMDILCKVSREAEIGDYIALDAFLEHVHYGGELHYVLKTDHILEDWESQSMNSFDWYFDGDNEWEIASDTSWDGSYSAKSKSLLHFQSADLKLEINALQPDTVSFYVKVSSEKNWDNLKFFIDGEEKGKWSGETQWMKATFPVEPGNHKFEWTYSKDGSISHGEDCAWIDRIILPKHNRRNDPPVITSIPYTKAFVNHLYKYVFTVEEVNESDYLFMQISDLPDWLSFTNHGDGTATLTGTPDIATDDTISVEISVDDGHVASLVKQNFHITIEEVDNSEPVLLSEIALTAWLDSLYIQYLSFDDPQNDILAFESIEKPDWLNFSVYNDSTVMLEGIPSSSDQGGHMVKIAVRDEFMIEPIYIDFIITVEAYLGMPSNMESTEALSLFPNPSSGMIYLSLPGRSFVSLNIVDLMGRIRYETNNLSGKNTKELLKLNISELESGVYFLQIKGEGFKSTKPFIKE